MGRRQDGVGRSARWGRAAWVLAAVAACAALLAALGASARSRLAFLEGYPMREESRGIDHVDRLWTFYRIERGREDEVVDRLARDAPRNGLAPGHPGLVEYRSPAGDVAVVFVARPTVGFRVEGPMLSVARPPNWWERLGQWRRAHRLP